VRGAASKERDASNACWGGEGEDEHFSVGSPGKARRYINIALRGRHHKRCSQLLFSRLRVLPRCLGWNSLFGLLSSLSFWGDILAFRVLLLTFPRCHMLWLSF
jgi:hypothetical protein